MIIQVDEKHKHGNSDTVIVDELTSHIKQILCVMGTTFAVKKTITRVIVDELTSHINRSDIVMGTTFAEKKTIKRGAFQ